MISVNLKDYNHFQEKNKKKKGGNGYEYHK